MKKVKVKIPAKINLSFDIVGVSGKFHLINSLVASCGIYDAITLSARKDREVTLKEKGIKAGCSVTENNAYKTAKAFIETFGTCGVDIVINKKIPVGGGMGGSSADIAGVLKGMQLLYGKDYDIYPLAERLGSDVTYMLKGGYAVMTGKGDNVESVGVFTTLHIVAIFGENTVTAGQAYGGFDKLGLSGGNCTNNAVKMLMQGDIESLAKGLENCLYPVSVEYCPEMATAITDLENAGAIKGIMTGSGSTVFGIFNDKKQAKNAEKLLKKKYGKRVKYTTTV